MKSKIFFSNKKHAVNSLKGFTLIELMVAVGIIAILSAIVASATSAQRARGRDARRIAEVDEIRDAVEVYFQEKYVYPDTLDAIKTTFDDLLPTDPKTGQSYLYVKFPSPTKGYCIAAVLESAPATGTCSETMPNASDKRYILQGPR